MFLELSSTTKSQPQPQLRSAKLVRWMFFALQAVKHQRDWNQSKTFLFLNHFLWWWQRTESCLITVRWWTQHASDSDVKNNNSLLYTLEQKNENSFENAYFNILIVQFYHYLNSTVCEHCNSKQNYFFKPGIKNYTKCYNYHREKLSC